MQATRDQPSRARATMSISQLPRSLREAVLLRACVGVGVTRAELVRDLRPLTAKDEPVSVWKAQAERDVRELEASGLVTTIKARIVATQAGRAHATAFVGAPIDQARAWVDLCEGALTAAALGLDPNKPTDLKAVRHPDQLRCLIVQAAFGFGEGRALSPAKLRASLAVVALERAFGHQIKTNLGAGGGLAAKPSRILAGQLSKRPRDYGSDARLIAVLASESLETANAEAHTLRLQLLHRWFARAASPTPLPSPTPLSRAKSETAPLSAPPSKPDNDRGAPGTRATHRPDLATFIATVQRSAQRKADGWPGNRKAFICHVWQDIKSTHPAWDLSEIEFKAMLAEAHRVGGLVLANADLKDKRFMQEFESSAIQYKNVVWHFVRVQEA